MERYVYYKIKEEDEGKLDNFLIENKDIKHTKNYYDPMLIVAENESERRLNYHPLFDDYNEEKHLKYEDLKDYIDEEIGRKDSIRQEFNSTLDTIFNNWCAIRK